MASASPNEILPIELTEIDGEPRGHDIDLGKRLKLSRPRAIRQTIERNLDELRALGAIATRRGAYKGKEFDEYWLNEEQALLVSIHSDAPNAPAVRRMLIQCFVAWRRGHLTPSDTLNARDTGGIVKKVLNKHSRDVVLPAIDDAVSRAVPTIIAEVVRRIATDNRNVATANVSIREVLDQMRVPSRKRRKLQGRIFARLHAYCLTKGLSAIRCVRTGTWLWPVVEATAFIRDECADLIRQHRESIDRQGRLNLVPRDPPG